MIDYFGKRVRIEEYIVRPRSDQFKFVALNERDNRFDYFTWKATFNKDLPKDLSVANKIAFDESSWGSNKPDYYLTSNEYAVSNTVDKVEWGLNGGHLVNSSGEYNLLYDNYYFKIGTKKNGQWNLKEKISYSGTNITSISDVTYYVDDKSSLYTYDQFWGVNGWWNNNIEVSAKGFKYKDGSYTEEYYVIDDEGNEATAEEFAKVYDSSTGKYIEEELLKWNFESVFSSPDFEGKDKKIDLVVEPKIYIEAGILPIRED